MNTQLIYVSKETAQVSNDKDGTFTNEVSQGILIKKGDEISVQGLAINSEGVGANIIEIPETIKDYNYQPNKQVIKGVMYINHNQEYTCKLPTNQISTTHIIKTTPTFGYLTIGGTQQLPFNNNISKNEDETGYGTRYFLGTFCRVKDSLDAVVDPPYATDSASNNNLYPNYLSFNFLTTELKFNVDSGYDNPDNIANKITEDLHSADISPLTSNLRNENDLPQSFSEENDTIFTKPTPQFIVSSKNSSSYLIYGVPRPNQNVTTGANQKYYSTYQSMLGVANPFYWYYGSRLLSADNNTKNLAYLEYDRNNGIYNNQASNGEIFNLFTFPFSTDANGQYVDINDGYILTTNLKYNEYTLNNLSKFIHSQKVLKDGVEVTSDELKTKRKDIFFTHIDIGRFFDEASSRWKTAFQPQSGANYLPSRLYNAGNIQTKLCKLNNAPTTDTFFNADLYNLAYLETLENDDTIKIKQDFFNIGGENLTPIQIAKKYDINILPIDTGINGNNQVCIGIILRQLNLQNNITNATEYHQRSIIKGNYCLVDFTFFNPPAEAVILLNPTVLTGKEGNHIDDHTKLLQVGSPNINLNFDGVRGKFNFQNLYWANYIGNPEGATEAVSTAGQEIITANYLLGSSVYGSTHIPNISFLKHSQSGIAILDIGSIDQDDNITYIENDADKIKNIYNKSLLRILGFTYEQLTNSYGLPNSLFTQRHYNSKFKLPYQNNFPYPLTNNPEIDTEKNIGLSVNASSLPMFNLDNEKNHSNINISALSSKIYAINLPNKLLFPYWLIQSDIIEGVDFNSMNSGNKQNILAVCNRAYISGDFAFSFQTSYTFKATKDFVLSAIKTAILNPDLTPATIDERTAVIYQVQSPIPLFQEEQIAEEELSKK